MILNYEITIDINDLQGDCEVSLADGADVEIIHANDLKSVVVTFDTADNAVSPELYTVSPDVKRQIIVESD